MNPLAEIRARFLPVLKTLVDDPTPLLAMIRPTQDPKFGDYQANCAMPLKAQLGRAPREIAEDLVSQVDLAGICEPAEIAGPGFINLRLQPAWLMERLTEALSDPRLGVPQTADPETIVVDYSSPNVAKPMHVGHIRSTVIGDAIARILRFLGHHVITDNHLGDWGTQFGMIIYGYKHFRDDAAFRERPISELGRLYKQVRGLMDYHAARQKLPAAQTQVEEIRAQIAQLEEAVPEDKSAQKQHRKELGRSRDRLAAQLALVEELQGKIAAVEEDPETKELAAGHETIGRAVLEETARLHEGDAENMRLWQEFLPFCRADIQRIYERLNIEFDHELGESFYHPLLASVVEELEQSGLATESEGATCVFLEEFDSPMIIRKQDGAFLYATTDLATIRYRIDEWDADRVLYVVDHRQQEHFDKLFAVARAWGRGDLQLFHVSFGTVLGDDGRPFKTRSGDTVGLEGLLDEAESRALVIAREQNPELDEQQLREISKVVGIGALKYADLSQNRSSDYKFSYDKMLALKGNTATYLQYAYARVQGIIRKVVGDSDAERAAYEQSVASSPAPFQFAEEIERQLGVRLVQFGEALDDVLVEYKPNLLCNYLYDLAQTFGRFFEQCPVRQAASEDLQQSRLQLCVLTGRTMEQGLKLLGIDTLVRM